jgi:prepilin-type N-terminal cleavage/methylation domain-containing protein
MWNKKKREGFTLLEILLVVAAISILAGIVIIAINPSKQLADTRNAQRRIDVNTILDAVYQYALDNDGQVPLTIKNGTCGSLIASEVCVTDGSCSGLTDLTDLTSSSVYVVSIPTDPQGSTTNGAGYAVVTTTANRVTVCAPDAERDVTIEITR